MVDHHVGFADDPTGRTNRRLDLLEDPQLPANLGVSSEKPDLFTFLVDELMARRRQRQASTAYLGHTIADIFILQGSYKRRESRAVRVVHRLVAVKPKNPIAACMVDGNVASVGE